MQSQSLSKLLKFDDIVIQCHNSPDADAIACGFAIQEYLKSNNKKARIVYGGAQHIQKSSYLLMLEELDISVEHIQDTSKLGKVQLLITVDCQPGESNVDWIDCEHLAVIDHHDPCDTEQYKNENIELIIIDNTYTACSSIVYALLKEVNYEIKPNSNLATALYYGLYSDSNKFQTSTSSGDEDMRTNIPYDKKIIRRFQGSNISQSDLEIMLKALSSYRHNSKYYFAISEAQYCDPNILGLTSDTLIEVNIVDACVVYCIREDIIKLSVRSCTEDIKADELIEYITSKVPNSDGGGTETKAGGKIDIKSFKEKYISNLYDRAYSSEAIKSQISHHISTFIYDLTEKFFKNGGHV